MSAGFSAKALSFRILSPLPSSDMQILFCFHKRRKGDIRQSFGAIPPPLIDAGESFLVLVEGENSHLLEVEGERQGAECSFWNIGKIGANLLIRN